MPQISPTFSPQREGWNLSYSLIKSSLINHASIGGTTSDYSVLLTREGWSSIIGAFASYSQPPRTCLQAKRRSRENACVWGHLARHEPTWFIFDVRLNRLKSDIIGSWSACPALRAISSASESVLLDLIFKTRSSISGRWSRCHLRQRCEGKGREQGEKLKSFRAETQTKFAKISLNRC